MVEHGLWNHHAGAQRSWQPGDRMGLWWFMVDVPLQLNGLATLWFGSWWFDANPIPILNYTAPSGPLKSTTPRLNQAFWVATYYWGTRMLVNAATSFSNKKTWPSCIWFTYEVVTFHSRYVSLPWRVNPHYITIFDGPPFLLVKLV